ncbi:MAG: PrsW family glutamic-type intramembrane protease [Candidatus Moranbacteria bacterium]|nr:PrsW family glutamic-type intramembrane protease [Candidatus Moranbacteria bacterium]
MRYLESFFWGIIAALGALALEFIIANVFLLFPSNKNITLELFISSFAFVIISAGVEETLKYIVIAKRIEELFWNRPLLLISFLVGLSFSLVEIALIGWQIGAEWKMHYRYLVEIILLHTSTAGLMGYFIATGNPKRSGTIIKAFGLAAIAHLVFNILAFYRSYFFDYLIFLLLLFLVAVNVFNVLRIPKKLAS